ncbi:hypothetical protein EDD21DRAFT_44245 [Dissophora ornata]|nr:hypothetical protein EDD21DRAFT_44245 [Dissophora ornata]
MKDFAPVREAIAEYGRQVGLCYGRAYQWAIINTSYWFVFVEWCQTTPKGQVIQRLERLSEIDGNHLDCESRCEHGKSISTGKAGHMPWCRSHKRPMVSARRRCAEFAITISEQDGSKVLVFDTVHQILRYLEDGEAYVAVSHVWGQRLFGQDTRTLGQCALSELKRLATYKGVECVWLDSLCIPSSPEARRKCIDGMRSIYQDATCVAVYDKGIMTADREDKLGFALEVSISEWNSRVWTLQEGLLNKNVIYVQEKNYISHKAERVHSFLRWYRAYAVTGMLSHIAAGKMEMEPVDVFSLAAGRTTSHDVDYVCGLGALLSKPVARIGVDLNSAAVALAKALDVIDIGLLCILCPRVSVDGYGWMPLGVKDMMPVWRTGVLGTVFDDGLHVEAYSLHITRLSLNETLLQTGETRYQYAEGSIIFFAHTMVDLDMRYDFICGMYDDNQAKGFFVALGDNEVVQYVTPVEAVTVYDEIRPSKNFYVIGGAPFLSKFAH